MSHSGKDGLVKVGSNTVAEVRSWSLEHSADVIEKSVMGDSYRSYHAGMQSATASIECYWDETDTNGQVALAPASEVTLVFIQRAQVRVILIIAVQLSLHRKI